MSDPIESPLPSPKPPTPHGAHRPVHAAASSRVAGASIVVAVVGLTLVDHGRIAPGPGPRSPPIPAATPFLVGRRRPRASGPATCAPELAVDPRRRHRRSSSRTSTATRSASRTSGQGRLDQLLGLVVPAVPVARRRSSATSPSDTRDRGLEIVGVSVQETTVDDVRAYAERYQLGYTDRVRHVGRHLPRSTGSRRLPTQFFIGPDGTILDVVNGPLSHQDAQARIDAWLPKD